MVKCDNFNHPGMLPISQESKEDEKVVQNIENQQLFEKPKSVHEGKCAAHTEPCFTLTNALQIHEQKAGVERLRIFFYIHLRSLLQYYKRETDLHSYN